MGEKSRYHTNASDTDNGSTTLISVWSRPFTSVNSVNRLMIGDNITYIAGFFVWPTLNA